MIRAVQDCVDDDGRAVQCRSFGRRGRQSLTSRCWGPEPYRWLGVNGGLTAAGLTDFVDQRRG